MRHDAVVIDAVASLDEVVLLAIGYFDGAFHDVDELFGWIMPRVNDFSTSRSYLSWLMGKGKKYDLDCRIKGGERHMIMSAEYERVFPMDIYPSYLIKAIIAGEVTADNYAQKTEDFNTSLNESSL